MRLAVGVLAVIALASCMKKQDEAAAREAEPATKPAPPTSVDEMIRTSFARAGTEFYVAEIIIEYVRADGTLDPTYGELTIKTGKRRPPKPPKPADDPNRPIGAPEPRPEVDYDYVDVVMAKCPVHRWTAAGMRMLPEERCSMFRTTQLTPPRCTVFGILAASAAAGAPANALAKIVFHAAIDDMAQQWTLTIDDNPRDIHFRNEGNDDCAPIVEKP